MNRIITAAITVLMLSSLTAAFAESNNLAAAEHPATGVILSPPAAVATGSEAYPDFGGDQGGAGDSGWPGPHDRRPGVADGELGAARLLLWNASRRLRGVRSAQLRGASADCRRNPLAAPWLKAANNKKRMDGA